MSAMLGRNPRHSVYIYICMYMPFLRGFRGQSRHSFHTWSVWEHKSVPDLGAPGPSLSVTLGAQPHDHTSGWRSDLQIRMISPCNSCRLLIVFKPLHVDGGLDSTNHIKLEHLQLIQRKGTAVAAHLLLVSYLMYPRIGDTRAFRTILCVALACFCCFG